MKLFILKTNIKTQERLQSIKYLLNKHPLFLKWSIDLEDVDKVLRIEARKNACERDTIQLIKASGFTCEALID